MGLACMTAQCLGLNSIWPSVQQLCSLPGFLTWPSSSACLHFADADQDQCTAHFQHQHGWSCLTRYVFNFWFPMGSTNYPWAWPWFVGTFGLFFLHQFWSVVGALIQYLMVDYWLIASNGYATQGFKTRSFRPRMAELTRISTWAFWVSAKTRSAERITVEQPFHPYWKGERTIRPGWRGQLGGDKQSRQKTISRNRHESTNPQR